jgi:hypothetical protein
LLLVTSSSQTLCPWLISKSENMDDINAYLAWAIGTVFIGVVAYISIVAERRDKSITPQ